MILDDCLVFIRKFIRFHLKNPVYSSESRMMNASIEKENSEEILEDILIIKISTSRINFKKLEKSRNDEEESINRSFDKERENNDDLLYIEDIANKISTYA